MRKVHPKYLARKAAMKKLVLTALFFASIWSLANPKTAGAATNLRQVQVTNGSQIDLLFDGKIKKEQIKAEFFNDIIQLSLTDATVYPAKISSVSGGNLIKIFAYQYAPKLVRCRLTVKGKAEDYKDLLSFSPKGRILTVALSGSNDHAEKSDQITLSSAQAARVVPGSQGDHSPAAKADGSSAPVQIGPVVPTQGMNSEEKALLEKVVKGTAAQADAPHPTSPAKTALKIEPVTSQTNHEDELQSGKSTRAVLGSGKEPPSPFGAFMKLIFVVAVFGVIALLAKKFLSQTGSTDQGVAGKISRFVSKGLGKKGALVEVVATHYLGPKKSISIVKVAGRTLVLGVTQESIQLITQFNEDITAPDFEKEVIGEMDFQDEPALKNRNPVMAQAAYRSSYAQGSGQGNASAASQGNGSGATAAGPAVFSEVFSQEKNRTSLPMPSQREIQAAVLEQQQALSRSSSQNLQDAAGAGVRSQIRSKLEGLKPL